MSRSMLFSAAAFAAALVNAEDTQVCAVEDAKKFADFASEDAEAFERLAKVEEDVAKADVTDFLSSAQKKMSKFLSKQQALSHTDPLTNDLTASTDLVNDAEAVEQFESGQIAMIREDAKKLESGEDDLLIEALATDKSESSEGNLMQVERVDSDKLDEIVKKQKENGDGKLLLVFYAKWCPHCKTFVLHDKTGDKANAPLNQFNTQLHEGDKATDKTKAIEVYSFDTARGNPPSDFPVQYIPTVYVMSEKGEKIEKFEGNPHDFEKLTEFALGV